MSQADVMRKVEEGFAVSTEEFEMTLDWRQKMLDENRHCEHEESKRVSIAGGMSDEPGFIF
jgi:hypothetical protein